MKRSVHEPERWSGRAGAAAGGARQGAPAPVEDELGGLFRRIRQSTAAPTIATATLSMTEVAGRSPARSPVQVVGWRGARFVWRLALAAAVVVVTGGAVSAARLIRRVMAAREQTLTIPAGSTVTVSGRQRRRLTLSGPARLDLARGDADQVEVTLAGGMLVAEAGGEPLHVRSEALLVTVPPGGLGRLDGRGGGAPSVDALAGELRLAPTGGGESFTLPVGHRWPEERAQPPSESPSAPPGQPSVSAVPAGPSSSRAKGHPAPLTSADGASVATPSRSRGEGAGPPDETRWLAQAFHALRVGKDPSAALLALDQYARQFPTGALTIEARVARVEALLALGRTADALPLLLTMRDREAGLTRDIQITRAELLAEKERCDEALPDFDDLLRSDARDAVGERALYGRAACLLRAGRTAGARQDLDRYLSAYPEGRFAGAARRAVGELAPLLPSSP